MAVQVLNNGILGGNLQRVGAKYIFRRFEELWLQTHDWEQVITEKVYAAASGKKWPRDYPVDNDTYLQVLPLVLCTRCVS